MFSFVCCALGFEKVRVCCANFMKDKEGVKAGQQPFFVNLNIRNSG
jgi:hypothetical protein